MVTQAQIDNEAVCKRYTLEKDMSSTILLSAVNKQ